MTTLSGPLIPAECHNATTHIIRLVQLFAFKEDTHNINTLLCVVISYDVCPPSWLENTCYAVEVSLKDLYSLMIVQYPMMFSQRNTM